MKEGADQNVRFFDNVICEHSINWSKGSLFQPYKVGKVESRVMVKILNALIVSPATLHHYIGPIFFFSMKVGYYLWRF